MTPGSRRDGVRFRTDNPPVLGLFSAAIPSFMPGAAANRALSGPSNRPIQRACPVSLPSGAGEIKGRRHSKLRNLQSMPCRLIWSFDLSGHAPLEQFRFLTRFSYHFPALRRHVLLALLFALLLAGLAVTAFAMWFAWPAGDGIVHLDERPYWERAERQVSGDFVVEAAALGAAESEARFGFALNRINVQPVWVRIENGSANPQWVFPVGIDPDYFPPYEVARRASAFPGQDADEIFRRLNKVHLRHYIPPGLVAVGFVYAHSDEGMKAFDVELHGPKDVHKFHFVVPVPGLPSDYFDFDLDAILAGAEVRDLSLPELRDWLVAQDCCPTSRDGRKGDPLNVAFVGSLRSLRGALISRGWDVTAPISNASLWRMASAFLFGSRYRYAPISPLYVYGREQDLAFQKARTVIDERNHMRIWLAPVTHEGKPVWIGQVSRDIGVKLTGKLWPPVTHVIDPDVDEARFFVLQDMMGGQSLSRLGFTSIRPSREVGEPYRNAEGDPYFTDGVRAVFFVSDAPVDPPEVEILDWRFPLGLEYYRPYENEAR